MIALYIFLGILFFITLLLLIPLRFEFRYGEEIYFAIRYLFLKFIILPEKKTEQEEVSIPKKEKGAAKKSSPLDKIKRILKEKGVSGFLSLVREILVLVSGSLKKMISHVRIQSLDVYFVAAAENAAEAAILYGEASAVIYPAVNIISTLGRCKKTAVTVDVQYEQATATAIAGTRFHILPLFIFLEALGLLCKGLPIIRGLR